MSYGLSIVTPPALEPIAMTIAKGHLRIDSGADDTELGTVLIPSARAAVEKYLGCKLITQTLKLSLDEFPCEGELEFPIWPVQSVTTVQYYDADDALQTLATSVYQVDVTRTPARLGLKSGQIWPATYARYAAVQITFVAGYGLTPATVPADLRAAMLLHLQDLYDGTIGEDDSVKSAKRLLDLNRSGVLSYATGQG